MSEQSARRCSICCISWPALHAFYGKCPECGNDTDMITNPSTTELLTHEEAASRINQINFERHLNGEALLPAPDVDQEARRAKRAADQASARKRAFDQVIQAGSFTFDELNHLEQLEKQLGAKRWEHDEGGYN